LADGGRRQSSFAASAFPTNVDGDENSRQVGSITSSRLSQCLLAFFCLLSNAHFVSFVPFLSALPTNVDGDENSRQVGSITSSRFYLYFLLPSILYSILYSLPRQVGFNHCFSLLSLLFITFHSLFHSLVIISPGGFQPLLRSVPFLSLHFSFLCTFIHQALHYDTGDVLCGFAPIVRWCGVIDPDVAAAMADVDAHAKAAAAAHRAFWRITGVVTNSTVGGAIECSCDVN
jgi:hypothetical protein